MQRAYAFLHIKSVDAPQRRLVGLATTPETDRVGDVIEPLGVTFKNPLPLLLFHDTRQPIGRASFGTPTPAGVPFEAVLSTVDRAGVVKARIDEAWDSLSAEPPLITGVSIGFRALEPPARNKDTGGLRFTKTEVLELSLVVVPANAGATIAAIKSCDTASSAAPGTEARVASLTRPGATGAARTGRAMTIQEQITQFQNTRAAQAARLTAIMTKAADEGRTLDASETDDYDTTATEVKSLDAHLVRLHEQEKLTLVKATPITMTTDPVLAAEQRAGVPVIRVTPTVPKGTAFARMCMALAAGHGDSYQTLQYAKQWKDSTPEVEQMVEHMWRTKAAVAAGTTTDSTWAGPLVVTQPLNEFLEMLRPRTLLGRIPGLRQVPFNVSVPAQTTGGTYGWVGQNKPKPVTKADFATVSVPFAKAAGIIVLSEELVKLSSPSAEALVREEMIAGMGQFLDVQFNDPAVAVAANVSPASITNGASTAAASGTTAAAAKADLAASIAVFTAAGIPLEGSVWLMSDSNAFGLAVSLNALGQPLFPGMTAQGGTLFGMPVVVSNNVSTRVILVHAPSILVADEGGVRIDVSREATVQMDSAPTDTVDATTVYVSLWQRNLVGLRAERMITWIRARTAAVRYITACAYTGA